MASRFRSRRQVRGRDHRMGREVSRRDGLAGRRKHRRTHRRNAPGSIGL